MKEEEEGEDTCVYVCVNTRLQYASHLCIGLRYIEKVAGREKILCAVDSRLLVLPRIFLPIFPSIASKAFFPRALAFSTFDFETRAGNEFVGSMENWFSSNLTLNDGFTDWGCGRCFAYRFRDNAHTRTKHAKEGRDGGSLRVYLVEHS